MTAQQEGRPAPDGTASESTHKHVSHTETILAGIRSRRVRAAWEWQVHSGETPDQARARIWLNRLARR